MILCIDSGNSRIKWAFAGREGWSARGVLGRCDSFRLAERLVPQGPVKRTLVANVAGSAAAEAITGAVRTAGLPAPEFVTSSAAAGGVRNGYRNPAQLGVDRWCALIGARSLTDGAAVVVGAGTATTIDTLDASGRFLGGFILPGFDLMRTSLARNTAQLPLANGMWQAYPASTDDAIVAGCLEAQLGAIERAFARIADQPLAVCLLFGGGAETLAAQLGCPHRHVENLVLEGLRVLGG